VVHRSKTVGDTTARVLEWSLPGGLDHYFKAISDLAAYDGFTREQATEIGKEFDTNVHPAPFAVCAKGGLP
jgi:hypothetical protein